MEHGPRSINAEDASSRFAELLDRVETGKETVEIVRDGIVVARIMPAGRKISTGADLQRNWENRARLPLEEADLWLKELEELRKMTPLPPSPWD